MDLVVLKKIESSILNDLGYIVRLERRMGIKFRVKFATFEAALIYLPPRCALSTPASSKNSPLQISSNFPAKYDRTEANMLLFKTVENTRL